MTINNRRSARRGMIVALVLMYASFAATAGEPKVTVTPSSAIALPSWGHVVRIDPTSRHVAVGIDQAVRIYELRTGTQVQEFPLKAGQIRSLAWSPDGKLLAVGGYQKVWILNASNGEIVRPLNGHKGYVLGLAWSPEGSRIVSACDDEAARIFEAGTGERQQILIDHGFPVTSVTWSPDEKWLVTTAGDETRANKAGEVFVRDAKTGETQHKLTGHLRPAMCAAISHDSRWLVTGGLDEKAILYPLPDGPAKGAYSDHERPVNSVQFLPGDEIIVSGGGGRFTGKTDIRVWLRDSGDDLSVLDQHEGKVTSVSVANNGRWLASTGHDKQLILWTLNGVPGVASESGPEQPASALSPENVPSEPSSRNKPQKRPRK